MEISAAATTSWLTRAQDRFCCKKDTLDKMLLTTSAICALVSCIIPIRPLAGAMAGGGIFVFGHKFFSVEHPTRFAPRTWTQLALGFGLNTSISTAGFCVPLVPQGLPLILLGAFLGLGIAYSDKLREGCQELYNRCNRRAAPPLPHYVPMPSAPLSAQPTLSAAAA